MTLKELISNTQAEDIITTLVSYYHPSEYSLKGYVQLLESLKAKEMSATMCRIAVEHATDPEGVEYEHVYGIMPGDEQTYGLELCERKEWLGMGIDPSTLERYSPAEIIAHCLYEMTFFGFSDEDVATFAQQLKESLDDESDGN